MPKKYYYYIGIVVVLAIILILVLSGSKPTTPPVAGQPTPETPSQIPKDQQIPGTLPNQTPSAPVPPTQEQIVITATDSGFSPATVTIKKGQVVTFKNDSSLAIWPASGKHPTHELYPEKGGCINSKFDACRELTPGESWLFKFDHVGTWPFHDHLNASHVGKIIVTE